MFTFTTSIDIPFYSDTAVLVTADCIDPGSPAFHNDPGSAPDIRIVSVIVDDLEDHPLNGSRLDYHELAEELQEQIWWLAQENYDPRESEKMQLDMFDDDMEDASEVA
jgi:hypothetical protein